MGSSKRDGEGFVDTVTAIRSVINWYLWSSTVQEFRRESIEDIEKKREDQSCTHSVNVRRSCLVTRVFTPARDRVIELPKRLSGLLPKSL